MDRPRRRLGLRTWVGLGLSAVLTVWFLRRIEWADLIAALGQVALLPVAGAAVLLLLEWMLRSLRWKVLLRPVAPDAPVTALFSASVIGAATNTLLPARAGEVAKPLVAHRKLGIGLGPLIASNVMERVFDLVGLVAVLIVTILTMPDQVGASAEDLVLVQKLKIYGGALGAIAATSLGIFFVLVDRGPAARGTFARILSPAPPPVQRVFLRLFDGFLEGLGSTRDRKGMVQAALLSLAIWFNGAAAIACLFVAFELPLPLSAACFTSVAIAIAVVVPQAPGFLGTFHVVIEKTLVLWAVAATPAAAYAIVFWAVSFVPVTATGLVALWREGLTLGGLWQAEPTPEG